MKTFKVIICSAIISICPFTLLSAKTDKELVSGKWLKGISVPCKSDTGEFSTSIQIYVPTGFISAKNARVMILLHPYAKTLTEWEKNSIAVKKAEEYRIVLVCPNMGKTVYESEYFEETSEKWSPYPGGKWVGSVLVPFLQKEFNLCEERSLTGIAGVEMGARGALLSAARYPDLFGFAGGISGLYDCASLTRHASFNNAYGPYKNNKDRWENSDSIVSIADNLKNTTIFLSHGRYEPRSPREQSHLLLIKIAQLKKKNPDYFKHRFVEKIRGELWPVWNDSAQEMFADFNEYLSSGAK